MLETPAFVYTARNYLFAQTGKVRGMEHADFDTVPKVCH